MTSQARHPEDIKAALRKAFGSVFAFEDAQGLPRKSVSDFLRGRPNQRVSDAISTALDTIEREVGQSDKSDASSSADEPAHFLNVGAP